MKRKSLKSFLILLTLFLSITVLSGCSSSKVSDKAKTYAQIAAEAGEDYLAGAITAENAQAKIKKAQDSLKNLEDYDVEEYATGHLLISSRMTLLSSEIFLHQQGSSSKKDVESHIKELKKYT